MKLSTAPHPASGSREWVTSLEPWQQDALTLLRERFGLDDDAVLRAGVTLFLALIATQESTVEAP